MRLKINEAIARSEVMGRKVFKKDIAAKLFPNQPQSTQQVNFANLCTGRTQRVKPEWIIVICDMCECTPQFLLGMDEAI